MNTQPTFSDLGVDSDFVAALEARGIVHPFPIQELTLPLALKGADVIGQARTGTGKTLGFGLPLLQGIDPSRNVTQAMVIVPTRELCIQVAEDLTIGADRGITSIAVYGGVGYEEQIAALTSGVHVVVGTPGRMLDHLGRGNLDVSEIHVVVLDEADEMLDMGFLPDVERLLVDVPTDRQTMLFSATIPTAIVKLARRFMGKPTFMRADETLNETAPTVDQHFFLVHRMDKPRVLARLLQAPDRHGAFVFTRTKHMADRLVRELEDLDVNAIAVHGDLRQATRESNLDRFREGKADVLVATEVAARGIDVSGVTLVVNYDCPDDEKMYLHRIGRTARAGSSGVAVTFAQFNEVDRVNVIRKQVAVDSEIIEVFSTSDQLTELFDLPEQTPWDHLTKSSGSNSSSGRSSSSGSNSSSGRSSSSDRSSSPSARGSSSGRSSSSSDRGSSAGRSRSSGGNRSSRRDSDRRDKGRNEAHGDRPRDVSEATTAKTSSDNGGGPARVRTRTRTRRNDPSLDQASDRNRQGDGRQRSVGRGGGQGQHSDTKGDDGRDQAVTTTAANRAEAVATTAASRAEGPRKRARGRRDPAKDSSIQGAKSQRSDADDDTRTNRDNRRSGSKDRSDNGSSIGRHSDSQAGGSKGSSNGSRTGSRRADSATGSPPNRTGDDGTAAGRRGNRRSNSQARDRDDRNRASGTAKVETTTRGKAARGDGTPRLHRRVTVEHLP